MSRLIVFLVFIAAAIGLGAASGCSTADVEAGLVLSDIAAGSGPSTLKRLTGRPQREAITWTMDGRRNSGDLYLPSEKAKVGLVLVPGAAKDGKDDPRLVALAQSLARARFLVLVPDIADLRAQEVSAADRLPIADAIRFLDSERRVPGLGIAAISYADVPAILAALDEPKVDFVVGIGGLYDLTAVITFFTTGHYRDGPGQPWRQAEPNAYGKWVFVKANARRIQDSGDRALLIAIAERKMADLAAPIDDLTAKLAPQGKSVMALLGNDDPAKVPGLIAALPSAIKAEIAGMDLAPRDLSGLKAKLFLIHGRDDRIIPWTESAALARMAPQAELTLLDNLAHADLKPGTLADSYALWRVMGHLLAERDRLAEHRP